MSQILKTAGIAAFIAALVCLVGFWLVGGNQQPAVGGSRFPNGLSADGTTPTAGQVRGSTLTITGATTLSGALTESGLATFDAGQLLSYTNSTSTVKTSQTLEQGDLLNYTTMIMTPNTGNLAMAIPASSTLTSLVPVAGDRQTLCIYNATTTAGINITLSAGVGIDLETVATSTIANAGAPILAIPSRGTGCVTLMRQNQTSTAFDISALFTPYINAD